MTLVSLARSQPHSGGSGVPSSESCIKVVGACICRAHGGAAQAHRLRWPSPYGDMLKGLLPGLARPAAFAHAAHAWNRLADMTWLQLV